MKKQTIKKIKDSSMFKGGNSNYSHWYLVNKDKHGRNYYRRLTHLYNPDAKRFSQLKRGVLEKVYVSTFETPSGLNKEIIHKNVKTNDVVEVRRVYINKKK